MNIFIDVLLKIVILLVIQGSYIVYTRTYSVLILFLTDFIGILLIDLNGFLKYKRWKKGDNNEL